MEGDGKEMEMNSQVSVGRPMPGADAELGAHNQDHQRFIFSLSRFDLVDLLPLDFAIAFLGDLLLQRRLKAL